MQPARVVGRVEVDGNTPAVLAVTSAAAAAASAAALVYTSCDTGGRRTDAR